MPRQDRQNGLRLDVAGGSAENHEAKLVKEMLLMIFNIRPFNICAFNIRSGKKFIIALLFSCALACAGTAYAIDTDMTIRVKAKGGTFIGNEMGGAHVVIRRRHTGDILFDGITTGGAGDAEQIMDTGNARDALLAGEGDARLEFSLDLIEPTPVTISVTGPRGQAQSAVTATADYLLIPGKDYSDHNGIVIELPGLSVDVINPPVAHRTPYDEQSPVAVAANVVTLSGDNIEPGGLWPPERFEVEAHIYRDTTFITTVPLQYGNIPSQYIANMRLPRDGAYTVFVTAYDRLTKEAGVDTTTFVLEEATGE